MAATCLVIGFTFDDTDSKGVASRIAEMRSLIAADPRNAERIFPFIGGKKLTAAPPRRIIDMSSTSRISRFNEGPRGTLVPVNEDTQRQQLRDGVVAPDYPWSVASDWPDLLSIVRDRVKPERDLDNRDARRREWWKYAERTPGLTHACKDKEHVLVQCRISSWLSFALMNTGAVFDISLNVFPLTKPLPGFAVLQSRVHEVWARFLSSSMKDDMRYTPSDCFGDFSISKGLRIEPSPRRDW